MKRAVRSGKWRFLAIFTSLALLLAACSSPLDGVPSEDAYTRAKNAYQEKFVPEQDTPRAEITNIPPGCERYTQQISRYYLPLAEN